MCKRQPRTSWKVSQQYFVVFLDLNNYSEFLLQQDIPDPKLLSETAFQMLSVAPKDVRLIYALVYYQLILVLYIFS